MLVLRLTEVVRGRTSIGYEAALGDLRLHGTVWYEDVDLHALAGVFGAEFFERLAVHIALFQLNAICSLKPDVIELGAYTRYFTPALAELWQTVFRNVWAQWRYHHALPDYVPRFAHEPFETPASPVTVPEGPTELLAFCGGGKDSLVALKLLERAQLPFATLAYSHSVYGRAEPQHELIERVASATTRARRERQWVIDDLLDAPVAQLRPDLGAQYVLAGETPASVFAALPLVLARGYRGLVVAHEASANAPQVVDHGEPVNHQWGKSFAAEQLLDRYIREELLANVRYFSVLSPVHDEVIMELLSRDAELAPLTHSCNVDKPWCGRCAKCAYVWLQFAAHLPADVVERTFGVPIDHTQLRALLETAPFECVGTVDEARLAYRLARARTSIPDLADIPDVDPRPFLQVGTTHGMPPHIAERIMPLLRDAAHAAARRLGTEQ